MDKEKLDSIYNYVTQISSGVNSTVDNTTHSFITDNWNIMAIIALVISIVAAIYSFLQWKATKDVNESVRTQLLSDIAFTSYLPNLFKILYIDKVKTLAAILFIRTTAKKSSNFIAVAEFQIEKIPYNSKIAEQMLVKYPESSELFFAVENLKRMMLLMNEDVTITRSYLVNPNISAKTKIERLYQISAGYSELCHHISNVLLTFESLEAKKSSSVESKVIGCIRDGSVFAHDILEKRFPTRPISEPELQNLVLKICESDRKNSDYMHRATGTEKFIEMLARDISSYYPVATIEFVE